MYFTKESADQLKCNICSTVLTTDDNNTAPKEHIRDSHRGVYELHKDILECSMGYQIEFLQFSVSDSRTQPVIIEEICETQPEVIQDQLPKNVENRQYIFLSSVKSDDTCRKRSWVWKYFDKLSQTIFRCNLCNVVLSIKGCNSNNMNRHIRSRHPVIYGSELEMKIKSDEKRTGKGKPLRSWVWTYFNRDSRTRATCKLCDKTINHGGNATGNLNRHLKIIHEKNDDPHYWIWKVFDNDSEDYYSCKLCTFKLAKTDNFDICVQIILDHLKDQHALVSAEQIFTVKDYEGDEG
ncbi:uncharacterized protein LOC121740258 isoform X2 [Aricia agestis]|uniref:uncharacterized protein LOC121740258 isoform X2 n=1 Tax=Aricia agestis TaxID=91739 RepID=UPI001C20C230|nr:uncharacterized protein LOC121740258 isoform X2 [Aricia agestis]